MRLIVNILLIIHKYLILKFTIFKKIINYN